MRRRGGRAPQGRLTPKRGTTRVHGLGGGGVRRRGPVATEVVWTRDGCRGGPVTAATPGRLRGYHPPKRGSTRVQHIGAADEAH
jgi:hypothetical protein